MARGVLLGRQLERSNGNLRRNSVITTPALVTKYTGSGGMIVDPSIIASLYQTTDLSSPVTASGQAVGRVADQLTGTYFSQATAANRPLYDVTDGIPSFLYDGSNDRLSAAGNYTLFRNRAGGVLVSAAKFVIGANYRVVAQVTDAAANSRAVLGKDDSNRAYAQGRRLDADSAQTKVRTGALTAVWLVLIAEFDWANAKLHVGVNLTARETMDPFQTAGNTSDTSSSSINLGGTNIMSGNIGRTAMLPLTGPLSAADREELIRWAAAPAGIVL